MVILFMLSYADSALAVVEFKREMEGLAQQISYQFMEFFR